MLQKLFKRFRGGNLLMEMLVVTSIIALAAVYLLPRYLGIRDSAAYAAQTANAASITRVALALIAEDQLSLPQEGEKILLLSPASEDAEARVIAAYFPGLHLASSGAPLWSVRISADGSVEVGHAIDSSSAKSVMDCDT